MFAANSGAAKDLVRTYIEDVFSTYVYVGNGGAISIENGVFNTATVSQSYTTSGTYSWTCPPNVTSVSVVCVGAGGAGGGGGGGGGGLGYKNNYPVTPGQTYTVVVGAPGTNSTNGGDSYFISPSIVKGGGGFSGTASTSGGAPGAGGSFTGDGGGNGGNGSVNYAWGGGGGGAGGYSGNGGNGGDASSNYLGYAGDGGGGGGGGGHASFDTDDAYRKAGGGGGVGLFGRGTSGSGGSAYGRGGLGGSGGGNGGDSDVHEGGGGGLYGGGAGGSNDTSGSSSNIAGRGAVRIVWPGNERQFPITDVSSEFSSADPSMVWVKSRSVAGNHVLFDSQSKTVLSPNIDFRLATLTPSVASFTSNGFYIPNTDLNINTNGTEYVSWSFRKATKFFDVVTYTGDGTNNRALSHDLGITPGFIIVKATDSASNWFTWHRSNPGANPAAVGVALNLNAAASSLYALSNTSPTSTSFYVDGPNSVSGKYANENGVKYVAYVFAHDTTENGLIQCGSYVTDASGNGTANLGWEPQFIIAKNTDTPGNWTVFDEMRGMFSSSTVNARTLYPNANTTEAQWGICEPTSTGFTLNSMGGAGQNIIYVAIRRGPMKTPTNAAKVFSVNTWAGSGTNGVDFTVGTTGFPIDSMFATNRNVGLISTYFGWVDRLRGIPTYRLIASGSVADVVRSIETNNTGAEKSFSGFTNFTNTSFGVQSNTGILNQSGWSYVAYSFRRAPGFFDVICYTGNGATRAIRHNLKVAPELMIFKSRNTAGTNWSTYSRITPTSYSWNPLQQDSGSRSASSYGPGGSPNFEELSAPPTSSVINIASSPELNFSGRTFVGYLFASCPGVSRVGSYIGTGSSNPINCGFSNGARFVMIKRTDALGDWYVWDSARGIISGNDPYLLLNTTAAENSSTNYINPYTLGFEVTADAPFAINAVGGEYIYLAIA